jgi:transposase
MTRDEFQAIYDAGPEATFAHVTRLLQEVAHLTARVAELERQLGRHSGNSSQPPAQDGFRRRPKPLRRKSARPVGGQVGHPGATLRLQDDPDEVLTHRATHCGGCGAALHDAPVTHTERRQVWELPVLTCRVTEHRGEHQVCPQCQTLNRPPFPAHVSNVVQYGPRAQAVGVYLRTYQLLPQARASELCEDLFGQRLTPATLGTALQTCAAALRAVETTIKTEVATAEVAHFDETGLRVAGQRQWLHVACTPSTTHYAAHAKRGSAATTAIGILPAFHGIAVHDAWAPYWQQDCAHALCNAHHLRELEAVVEQGDEAWAQELQDLLRAIKQRVAQAQAAGAEGLEAATHEAFQRRYDALVATGLQRHPAQPAVAGQKGRTKQSKTHNLLVRLRDHAPEVLRFMTDFRVPFDNNLAERDLRMMKVQQKISGGFRSLAGAEAFCRIRSYISTVRKRGGQVLAALEQVFTGTPALPEARAV